MNKQSSTYTLPGSMVAEKEFRFEVFCKHQGHLINQGITICNIGHDLSKCDTCEFREPETITSKMTSTSTQVDHIYHGDNRRQWYEEYHKYGAYWAKFWLTSGKKYAKTPKQIIRWILESHYQKKFKQK